MLVYRNAERLFIRDALLVPGTNTATMNRLITADD